MSLTWNEDLYISDADKEELMHYEVLDITLTNKGNIKKVNETFTFDNIDDALTQMDRQTDYGMSDDPNKYVVLKQGKTERTNRVLKTWFNGDLKINSRSIYC
jgi:hypothetical protein|tara:strand:+ start:866 stop:1171 length:306 start_codon:yes stop_codon:yes gene_type:complete